MVRQPATQLEHGHVPIVPKQQVVVLQMLHVYHVHCHGDELSRTDLLLQHINHLHSISHEGIRLLNHVPTDKHVHVPTEVCDEHTQTKAVHCKDVVTEFTNPHKKHVTDEHYVQLAVHVQFDTNQTE
jgi:hypothetical protein